MSDNASPLPPRPFPVTPDSSKIDQTSLDSRRPVDNFLSPIHHFRHKDLFPFDLLRQLLLYQYGVFLGQLPKHIFSLIYENTQGNFKPLTDKEIEKLQKLPEKIKEALKSLKLEKSINDLKKAENPFKDPKGDFKEKLSLERMIFEKLKNEIDQDKKEKKNSEEPNITKILSEGEDISKESLAQNQVLRTDKSIIKDKVNKEVKKEEKFSSGEKTDFVKNKEQTTPEKQFLIRKKDLPFKESKSFSEVKENLNFEKNRDSALESKSRQEKILQKDSEKGKDKNSEKILLSGESRVSDLKENSSKFSLEFLKNQNQAHPEKQNSFLGKGASRTSFIPNPTSLVVPYILQEKARSLFYKTQKFKLKKVVKKEKNPSHEKQDDEELNYLTVDDIS